MHHEDDDVDDDDLMLKSQLILHASGIGNFYFNPVIFEIIKQIN